MESMVRVLNAVFWVAAPLFVAWLFLSDITAGLIGDKGLHVVNAVLLVVIVVCSGAITSYEFGRNPVADTEHGEWTNRQLFYAVVFTISFFMAVFFVGVALFLAKATRRDLAARSGIGSQRVEATSYPTQNLHHKVVPLRRLCPYRHSVDSPLLLTHRK